MLRKPIVGGIILFFLLSSVIPITNSYETNKANTIYVDEDGTLSGYVKDTSMNPIEGARVRVNFHDKYEENYTNSSGYYHVSNIPICYCIKNTTASKEGYRTILTLLTIDETTTYNFVLPLNLSDGLVGYWDFNEGSGDTVYDISGYGNDGSIIGAGWTTGISENALSFDGNDYVDAGTDASLKSDLPISISVWINIDETNEAFAIIFTNGIADYPLGYYGCKIGFNEYHKIFIGYGDGDTGPEGRRSKWGTTVLDFDTWHHLVGIIRGPTDMDIYINGNNDGGTYSGTGGDIAYSDGPSYIGQDGSFENFFSGIVDEVKVYNSALSENEIIDLFEEPFDNHILIGKISHLNSDEYTMSFDAEDLRVISLSPFEFRRYSSGEKITVLSEKIGILTTNFAFGIFKAII